MRWGMVIEQKRCIGCNACTLACKAEHFLPPEILWNRVLIAETGKYPVVNKLIYSVRCNQCDEPKCVDACPTGATRKRGEDNIVIIDPDQCVGCRYCMLACPYQARSIYEHGDAEYFPGQGLTEHEKIGKELYPHEVGIVQKCTFCKERIDTGLAAGLKPGTDRDATPACVISCPTQAMHFGDLDDPYSEINRIIKEKRGKPFHAEYGTGPSIYYVE